MHLMLLSSSKDDARLGASQDHGLSDRRPQARWRLQATKMLALILSAGLACVAPDCDRPDYGSCGVACCKVLVSFPNVSSASLMAKLNTSLAAGGPDGRFTLMPTAESPYGFGDLRPYHPDAVSFIGQAFHQTEKKTYTDTINFLLLKESGSATLRAHSISQIGGAYGDDGQNYKNIAVLLKSLNVSFIELEHEGCDPAPAA